MLDRTQARLDRMPEAMIIRRQTVEHPFGTLKAWMGSTHFLTKTLEKVKTEMSSQVLAYNIKRMVNIFGVRPLMQASLAELVGRTRAPSLLLPIRGRDRQIKKITFSHELIRARSFFAGLRVAGPCVFACVYAVLCQA